MAGNSIKINTDEVEQIASDLERLNGKLEDTLNHSKQTINDLDDIWEGEAAQATISAYNSFAQTYFQTYKDVLDQYVKFLRQNVAKGYTDTETTNINLADAFK
ncbi:MAG: WXG100 family type VII secretion target [Ruminococcus sp.]|nr:WXG100 family type VII secretion target [Ruminococcus sp.]